METSPRLEETLGQSGVVLSEKALGQREANILVGQVEWRLSSFVLQVQVRLVVEESLEGTDLETVGCPKVKDTHLATLHREMKGSRAVGNTLTVQKVTRGESADISHDAVDAVSSIAGLVFLKELKGDRLSFGG